MKYVAIHIWGENEITADIWNGRWTRHMWEEALTDVDEKVKASQVTSKLFEMQSAPSRHRFKLTKRLVKARVIKPGSISHIIKKQKKEEQESYNNGTNIPSTRKRAKVADINHRLEELQHTQKKKETEDDGNNIKMKTTASQQSRVKQKQNIDTQTQLENYTNKYQKCQNEDEYNLRKSRKRHTTPKQTQSSRLTYDINIDGKLEKKGINTCRGKHCYRRHTTELPTNQHKSSHTKDVV